MSESSAKDAMMVATFINNLVHLEHVLTHACRSGETLLDQDLLSIAGDESARKVILLGLETLVALDEWKSLAIGESPLFPGMPISEDDSE